MGIITVNLSERGKRKEGLSSGAAPGRAVKKLFQQSKDRYIADRSNVNFSVDNHGGAKMTGIAESITLSSLVRIVEFLLQGRRTVGVQHIVGFSMLNCPNDGVGCSVC